MSTYSRALSSLSPTKSAEAAQHFNVGGKLVSSSKQIQAGSLVCSYLKGSNDRGRRPPDILIPVESLNYFQHRTKLVSVELMPFVTKNTAGRL